MDVSDQPLIKNACLDWGVFSVHVSNLCFAGTWLLTKGPLCGYVSGYVSRYVLRYLSGYVSEKGGGVKHASIREFLTNNF